MNELALTNMTSLGQQLTLMLAPFSIRWSLVEHPTNRGKLVDWGIFSWDAQLIQELSLCCISHTYRTKGY